jgi:hypothetical protein
MNVSKEHIASIIGVDGSSRFLRNPRNLLRNYMVAQSHNLNLHRPGKTKSHLSKTVYNDITTKADSGRKTFRTSVADIGLDTGGSSERLSLCESSM